MSIEEKLEELKQAEAEYEEAEKKARFARSEETQAKNRLNEAQKVFDAEVETLREDTPGGDWKESRHRVSGEAP